MTKKLISLMPAIALAFILLMCSGEEKDSKFQEESIAFPGAEGYGRFAKGGRGGDVYHVTNLNDSDEGSLRYGIENAQGPRTIVFDVSGIILLESTLSIQKPYLTLAGQTAPGAGICIKNYGVSIHDSHDIIIRHLRFRPGDDVGRRYVGAQVYKKPEADLTMEELQSITSKHVAEGATGWQTDALSTSSSNNIIIDHCSASWANDEMVSFTQPGIYNITLQWTMITESLNNSTHPKGVPHGYGSIIGGHATGTQPRITLHHNLYAHNYRRNPHFAGDREGNPPGSMTDFRNNIIYDWGVLSAHNYTPQYTSVNFVNNYLKPGPSTDEKQRTIGLTTGSVNAHVYMAGNHITSLPEADNDNWLMANTERGMTALQTPMPTPPVNTVDAHMAYEQVLVYCGAFPRDDVDWRIVEEISNGGGHIINSAAEVGGWPAYPSESTRKDSDGDGMPDDWEKQHKFNPDDASDGNGDEDHDGFTNLEEYLHHAHEKLLSQHKIQDLSN